MDEQHSPHRSPDPEPVATYEIRLRGTHVAQLKEQFPSAALLTTRTETVLFRSVEGPEELDALVAELLSMGLVLNEIHELPSANVADDDPRPPAIQEVPS